MASPSSQTPLSSLPPELLGNLVFIGSTLGPLFLHDPKTDWSLVGPLYETLAASDAQELAEAWPFGSPSVADVTLDAMVKEAALATSSEEGLAALADEYRRLFVGPEPKAAPPWGSVYTDKDQVVFGASTLALRDWLRSQGISIDSGESDEPEDHIGTLLVLLSWLAQEHPDLIPEFLKLHLLPWADHFLEIMQGATDHSFFEGLAVLTRESLADIQKELGLSVETPRFYR